MVYEYTLQEVAPYINWVYFFHAWGMATKPQAEKDRLRQEAIERIERHGRDYRTLAVCQLFDAYGDGDDIVVSGGRVGEQRIPLLRQQQQGSECLCLADFIAPQHARNAEPAFRRIALFATTVSPGLETDFAHDPYEKLMMQLLADRLAEATAERMHEQVRRRDWGYAPGEQLSISDMLQEHWQGIRPAVGYPSLPDTSLNFLIDQLIDMKQIGIRLTENGAMKPHASVSGLIMAHPAARYFAVGKIGEDQLRDYAARRGLPLAICRKFLAANL